MALLYQLLPTHLALQPALSGRLTQSIPLNDASYSLSTDDTLVRKGCSPVYWIRAGNCLQWAQMGWTGVQIPQSQG